MTSIDWLLDTTVASSLSLVAWTMTRSVSMSRRVVLFIAFGMLSTLAWVGVSVADVALVEASIGAGLSGALFMTSLRWAEASRVGPGRSFRSEAGALLVTLLIAVMLLIALSVGPIVFGLPPQSAGLVRDVTANLEATGVRQQLRLLAGAAPLGHSREHADETIFGIELASAITLALVLATFFSGVGAFERLVSATGRRTRDVP